MPYVVPKAESRQYDGTNGPELAEWVGAAEVVSLVEGALTLSVTAATLTYDVVMHPGWWIIRQNGQHGGTHSPEDYERIWHELPTTPEV